MNILGISAFFRESAVALVVDGAVAATAVEATFTEMDGDTSFPVNAVNECLKKADLKLSDITCIVFSDDPRAKVRRLFKILTAEAPKGVFSFNHAVPIWLKHQLHIRREIRRNITEDFKGEIIYKEHSECIAAGSFYHSTFDNAAILTIDGTGEWVTASASISYGKNSRIKSMKAANFPHSIGLLHSALANFAPLTSVSEKYTLKELTTKGDACYVDLIKKKIVDVMEDGSLWLDISYFNSTSGQTLPSRKFYKLFACKPGDSDSLIIEKKQNLAASIQQITEEVVLKSAKFAKEITNAENLCLAGNIFSLSLNSETVEKEKIFKDIYLLTDNKKTSAPVGAAMLVFNRSK